jgi:putative FmdB family regulatory protein
MPTYDFECEPCAYYTEIKQGFNDPSTLKCPHCGQNTLVKVFINPPAVSVRGEPKTIGHLAERNTQNMGKYEIEDRNRKNNIGGQQNSEHKAKKDLHRKINSMTPQQKVKWIKEGD